MLTAAWVVMLLVSAFGAVLAGVLWWVTRP